MMIGANTILVASLTVAIILPLTMAGIVYADDALKKILTS